MIGVNSAPRECTVVLVSNWRTSRAMRGLLAFRLRWALFILVAGPSLQAADAPVRSVEPASAIPIRTLDGRSYRGPIGAEGKPARREDVFFSGTVSSYRGTARSTDSPRAPTG